MRHHEDALAGYIERSSDDPGVLGVVVSGSVARGQERADSDIDLYLIVTEERWDEAFQQRQLMFVDRDGADYPGGYFDVKLATLSYLDDAAERGDDPVRDSFARSRIVFSRIPDLEERIARITDVPDAQWDERILSQLAQARLHGGYFLPQAVEHGDPLLTAHAAVHLAWAAARALLAVNRVCYAGPKYLRSALVGLEHVPQGIDDAIVALVEHPSIEAGNRVLALLESDAGWQLDDANTLSTFVLDNELSWRYRTPPPEYR